MNDRDGNRSNPYKPNPQQCCEACVFGTGKHAEWCQSPGVLTKEMLFEALEDFELATAGIPRLGDCDEEPAVCRDCGFETLDAEAMFSHCCQ